MRLLEKARVLATVRAALRVSLQVEADDVMAASRLVGLLEAQARAMAHLGASEAYRVVQRVEKAILAAGDSGLKRRELYARVRVDKRTLDLALDTLSDRNVVFTDWRDKDRAGRLVHVDTEAGKHLLKQHDEKDLVRAELERIGGIRPWGKS